MVVTDPIADMLTRVRNACMASHSVVEMPCSKVKKEIASLLKNEGYISDFEEFENEKKHRNLRLKLKYVNNQQVITGLKRISKPGLRIYVGHKDVPRVLGGFGVAVISTSQGIMTDKNARNKGIGGEVLCYVW
ncbi:MAG: 30S ribosomal protein S8 [Candidatus Sericytochromatia bacterium]